MTRNEKESAVGLSKKWEDRLKEASTWQEYRVLAHEVGDAGVSSRVEGQALEKCIETLKSTSSGTKSTLTSEYDGIEAVSLSVSELFIVRSREDGMFTVDGDEVEGAMIYEGKSSGSLTWDLTRTREVPMKLLLSRSGWKSSDAQGCDMDGFCDTEVNATQAVDADGNVLDGYDDFDGSGEEILEEFMVAKSPPSEIGISFEDGRSLSFSQKGNAMEWDVIDASQSGIGTVKFEQLIEMIAKYLFH